VKLAVLRNTTPFAATLLAPCCCSICCPMSLVWLLTERSGTALTQFSTSSYKSHQHAAAGAGTSWITRRPCHTPEQLLKRCRAPSCAQPVCCSRVPCTQLYHASVGPHTTPPVTYTTPPSSRTIPTATPTHAHWSAFAPPTHIQTLLPGAAP
jgi:hypothetical protein